MLLKLFFYLLHSRVGIQLNHGIACLNIGKVIQSSLMQWMCSSGTLN